MAYIKVHTATFTNFWINKSPLFNLIVNLFRSLIRSQRLVIENILQAFDLFRLFYVFLSFNNATMTVKALNKGYLFSVVPEFCTSVFVILSGATCKNKCFFAIITYFPCVRLLVNVYQLYDSTGLHQAILLLTWETFVTRHQSLQQEIRFETFQKNLSFVKLSISY